MPNLQIDTVYPKNEVYPFIVNFQNGYTKDKFKSVCEIFIDEKKNCKTIATDVEDALYVGEESEEPLGRTLILARNSKTGKVRLVEVGTVNLKPDLNIDLDSSLVYHNSALELGRKFGSKKYKQHLEQVQKLKQNEEAVVAQMANVSQNLTQDQLDISYDNPSDSISYMPPMNRQATHVKDVFDIDTILTSDQYENIIAETSDIDIMENLHVVFKNLTRNDLSPKLKVLALFASSLYNTVFLKAHEIARKSFVACPQSITLNKHILADFFSNVNGKRMRPIHYKDKALIHSIVFLLLMNNFKFRIDEFCMQMKISIKSISMKVAMIGAYMVRTNEVNMVQLKLPLNKPPSRRKSNKL